MRINLRVGKSLKVVNGNTNTESFEIKITKGSSSGSQLKKIGNGRSLTVNLLNGNGF